MGPDSLHGCDPVVEPYRYDGYGAVTVLDADWSVDGDSLSDVENPYVFTGRRLDAESGLMQYRNRYYDAVLGRFVSRDPLGYLDSLNLSSYVGGRISGVADPSGLYTVHVDVGNPKLPHYFEEHGELWVVTGTIWHTIVDGRVVFAEGVARTSRICAPRPGPPPGPVPGPPCGAPRGKAGGPPRISYEYAGANPEKGIDPLGLFWKTPWGVITSIVKCAGKIGLDRFFVALDLSLSQACKSLRVACSAAGNNPPANPLPYSWPTPDIDPADFLDFLKCLANEGIGFPIFDDSSGVTWHRHVFLSWVCLDNPQEQTLYLAIRGRVTVAVRGVKHAMWVNLGAGECGPRTHGACCCEDYPSGLF